LGDKVEMKTNLKRLVNFENIIDKIDWSTQDNFYSSVKPRFRFDMFNQKSFKNS